MVVVGAGFAGFNAARELSKLVGATSEIVVINSTDYLLYLPLMPQVSGGLIEPAHVRISLPRRLRKTRFVLGAVNHVDSRQKVVSWGGSGGHGRPGPLRSADPDRGQCKQAAADPGYRRLRARVPATATCSCPRERVPDLTRPGRGCGMTAQHAQRQDKQVDVDKLRP